MPDDIPPIPDETHAAIVALIGRLEQLILEVRACAEASPKINELRLAPPKREGSGEDRRAVRAVSCGTVNIRSLLSDLRSVLYSLPSAIRKEIEGLAIWQMAGAPPSLWVGAAEPHLMDLRALLQSLVRHAQQAEMQADSADSQESAHPEISSAGTPFDRISNGDLYAQARRQIGTIKALAAQLKVAPSTLCAYAQILRGESPARKLNAATFEKIKAAIRAIAAQSG